MCKCRYTTWDVLEAVNKKRAEANLSEFSYDVFMLFYRPVRAFIPPDEKIGCSYIFRKGKVNQIVRSLWKKSYSPRPHVDWFGWKQSA